MCALLLWCPAEDNDIVKIDESKLALYTGDDDVYGVLQHSRRIAKSKRRSNKLI